MCLRDKHKVQSTAKLACGGFERKIAPIRAAGADPRISPRAQRAHAPKPATHRSGAPIRNASPLIRAPIRHPCGRGGRKGPKPALGVLAEAEHVGASGRRTAGAALEDVFADPSSVNMRLMRAESSAGVSTAAAKFVRYFVFRVHLLGRSPRLTGRNNDQSIEDYVWRLCQAAANGLVPINCNDDMTPSSDSFRVVVRPAFIVLYSA
ncbi:hypothetical protein THAOC_18862 [Thalassiosira oceanica]|uniref:Uncharacterized protein n=1 Tax=Thalassiosira oceanica TaxID=159749 RepID=K0S762_THAOC|nr:hypothetical protein THAOC_18862 [Thalassiosira oceanica]|eukprot:EJK60729.1 hypothetical protein THAOC_18862 [Thalassiosira oceanica]